jgi:molybdopterin converting factor subunit 1
MSEKIRVICFAALGEKVGKQVEIPVDGSLSAAELRQRLMERYPECHDLIRTCMIAVNHEYAADDTRMRAEDEIALIPLVSGG